MTVVEVPLCDLLEAPARHRIREAKPERIKALAEAFKDGSPLTNPLKAYRTNGKWHVVGGLTRLAALRLAFGADSAKPIPVSPIRPDMDRDARLEAAKDNNVEPMTTLEWQGLFAEWLPVDKTQDQVARRFGVTQQFVSRALNFDPFSEKVHNSVVKSSEKGTSHLENAHGARESVESPSPPTLGDEPTPPSFSPHPETPLETGESGDTSAETGSRKTPVPPRGRSEPVGGAGSASPSKPALDGSNGRGEATGGREGPSGLPAASPVPLLSPYVDALQSAVEGLGSRSLWQKAEDAQAQGVRAEALYWRLGDILTACNTGRWNGETPKALEHRPLPAFGEGQKVSVETHGESVILKILEDGRFRIKDAKGKIQIINARMILAGRMGARA